MIDKKLKQYLLSSGSIPDEDKRYVASFHNKTKYIDSLIQVLISSVHETVYGGFGNVNAGVCFIFGSRDIYDKNKNMLMQNIMAPYNISEWQAYITFIDKCHADYMHKYSLLANELNAVKPSVFYVITDDKKCYDSIIAMYGSLKIQLPARHFHVPLNDCINGMDSTQGLRWPFNFIINYNNTTL